jgi:cytochrome c-type biogenesis protein CcsB
MDFFNLEKFLSNFSFLILFACMVFYWVQLSFNFKNRFIGTTLVSLANFSILFLLILRWKESGHFPLSNLYESFLFLSWNFTLLHLILEKMTTENFRKFFGAITAPTALLIFVFATFSLPEQMQKSSALVPALQSNWLMMHVTLMILSYAALIGGSLLSIAFLIVTLPPSSLIGRSPKYADSPTGKTNFSYENQAITSNLSPSTTYPVSAVSTSALRSQSIKATPGEGTYQTNLQVSSQKKANLALLLDNLSYRILGIGFPLLTIGILSGAVWANEAWGSYWNWDPKETWALLTWLVFAIYLHTRLTKGWQGKKPAIIASLGFVTVWVCFLGVNLLGEGLHSYGFFAKI